MRQPKTLPMRYARTSADCPCPCPCPCPATLSVTNPAPRVQLPFLHSPRIPALPRLDPGFHPTSFPAGATPIDRRVTTLYVFQHVKAFVLFRQHQLDLYRSRLTIPLHTMSQQPLYLGWDLSTQQLKGIAVTPDLKKVYEAKADFDGDFGSKYGITKGVLQNPDQGEIFAPTAMWFEAIDLVLKRLKDDGLDFSRVKGISGAGMQHGTVFWSKTGEEMLQGLHGGKSLIEQLGPGADGKEFGAFSHPHSPNWQDSSTQVQCEQFDECLGGPQRLADATGSSAHHVCCVEAIQYCGYCTDY